MNNKEQQIEGAAEQVAQITEINGDVTAEQIQAWKNQYGRVAEVRVKDEEFGEEHIGYFRRPDMTTMQAVNSVSKSNEVKASEVMFENCWLGGSPQLKTDAIYKMDAMAALGSMFGKCVRTLKNL